MTDADIAAAARTYVAARRAFQTARERKAARIALDESWAALCAAVGSACPVCEDGATLEADAACDGCGRRGSCPRCADDDCPHLDAAQPAG